MKAANQFVLMILVVVGFMAGGCAPHKSTGQASWQLTVPNGRSLAPDNASRAPTNDPEAMRSGWNHGNGALWVSLPKRGLLVPSNIEKDGYLRVKFGWWRGVRGQLIVTGRRLDAPAPPLRSDAATVPQVGDIGFNPCLLFFPTDGIWEVTGRVGNSNLTFVVRVVKEIE